MKGTDTNGPYVSFFFHSFMLRWSQPPHALHCWLTHLWDAPGTPSSLGRPRSTEIYGSVEAGGSSEQINSSCCILAPRP